MVGTHVDLGIKIQGKLIVYFNLMINFIYNEYYFIKAE